MKTVLYGLLMALVPDVARLPAGAHRVSQVRTSPVSLVFEVQAREGTVLICSLSQRESDCFQSPEIRLLADVSRRVIRPLDFQDRTSLVLAGDRLRSIDVHLELELSARLMSWLLAADAAGHRLDGGADVAFHESGGAWGER